MAAPSSKSRVVQVDGLVLLKIQAHAQAMYPAACSGSLLGLDISDQLIEVTHSFGYPLDPGSTPSEGESYELGMMKSLRDVKVDNNAVGWYQCAGASSGGVGGASGYCTKDTIAHQIEFQETIPNSVLVVYDGLRTSLGQLSLKAVRLTDAFMAAHKKGRLGMEAIASLSPSQIWEELPVKIRNPHLISAALFDLTTRNGIQMVAPTSSTQSNSAATLAAAAAALAKLNASSSSASSSTATSTILNASGAVTSSAATAAASSSSSAASSSSTTNPAEVDFARLDLNSGPFLERHLEALKDVTEGLLKAQQDTAMYQRKMEQQQRQRETWIARRREENALRIRNGEDPLPEEDPSLPFFRPLEPPRGSKDPLDVLLMSANISAYCNSVSKFAGASFGKLFLASSLHK